MVQLGFWWRRVGSGASRRLWLRTVELLWNTDRYAGSAGNNLTVWVEFPYCECHLHPDSCAHMQGCTHMYARTCTQTQLRHHLDLTVFAIGLNGSGSVTQRLFPRSSLIPEVFPKMHQSLSIVSRGSPHNYLKALLYLLGKSLYLHMSKKQEPRRFVALFFPASKCCASSIHLPSFQPAANC